MRGLVPFSRAPRRGAGAIVLALALLGVLVAAATSFLLLTAVRGKQSAYERNAIQALYAAEAGIETTLALLARGEDLPGTLRGECGNATWEASAESAARDVTVTATGAVEPTIGPVVQRRLIVSARRAGAGYEVRDWRRVPVEALPQRPTAEPASPTSRTGEW